MMKFCSDSDQPVQAVNYFREEALSRMVNRVLKTLLIVFVLIFLLTAFLH